MRNLVTASRPFIAVCQHPLSRLTKASIRRKFELELIPFLSSSTRLWRCVRTWSSTSKAAFDKDTTCVERGEPRMQVGWLGL